MEVTHVHKRRRLAITEDHEVLPITEFFDVDGAHCTHLTAVSAVIGPSKAGKWYAIDLAAFAEERLH